MATGRREIPFRLTAENRTQAAFRELRRDVNQINTLARSFAGVFGIAFGAAGLAGITRSFSEATREIDETAKKARELETNLTDLQRIRFTGDILGFGDQVDRLLQRLQAARGAALTSPTGQEAAAFQSVGIALEDLRNLDPSGIFSRLQQVFISSGDAANNAAVAYRLVGTRLQGALLRASQVGPQALADIEARFDAVGGATEQAAERIEELNDGFRQLQQVSARGIADIFEAALPPANELREIFGDIVSAINTFRRQSAGENLLDVAQFLSPLRIISESAQEALNELGIDTTGISDSISRSLATGLQSLPANIRDTVGRSLEESLAFLGVDVNIPLSTASSDAAQLADELDAGNQELFEMQLNADELTSKLVDADRAAARAAGRLREQNRLRRIAIQETAELESAAEFLLARRQQQQDTGRAVTGSAGQLAQAVINANQQAADPSVQVLEAILRRLEQEKAAAAVESLKETIDRLNNPVFS